jgi:SAM-dependent methyltransferase
MGFPRSILPLLRCPRDGGELSLADVPPVASLEEARVGCRSCRSTFEIRGGILDLLGDGAPSQEESAFELGARDREASRARGAPGVSLTISDELEIAATLRLLSPPKEGVLLELGCGAGMYTRLLQSRCAKVVAVDFSWENLLLNRRQLPRSDRVGLVRADVATLRLSAGTIDCAFTTLYSNLPSREVRDAMNATVQRALRPGGVYLVSAHHMELRRRWRGQPASDRYRGSGIYFRAFTRRELSAELSSFSPIVTRTCDVLLPIVSRYVRARWISKAAEYMPGLNEFGGILLARASKSF